MERIVFEVQSRAELGKGANKRYRRGGLLPSVVYSHGEKSVPVLLPYKEFWHHSRLCRSAQIFTLKSKDSNLDGRAVVVKEVQRSFTDGQVLHVDFQALREDEKINVKVTLTFKGEAVGVKLNGGVMATVCHELGIRCLPRDIPETIDVDVSSLDIGDSIHAEAVKLPAGVELADKPEETIVSVVVPKVVEEAKPVEAAPAEGAEAVAAAAAGTAAAPAAAATSADTGKKADAGKKAEAAKK